LIRPILYLKLLGQHWVFSVIRLFEAFVYFKKDRQPAMCHADLTQPAMDSSTGFILWIAVGDVVVVLSIHAAFSIALPVYS